ncbi:hypothetical protein ACS5PN_26380 [Roseateles sp. NT4]|uniref:hypothetical protein n=1 Tax=Roseateles sp. NT4 TaxID=3453715 RepID=UPI003EEA2A03
MTSRGKRWAVLGLLLVAGAAGLLGWRASRPAQLAVTAPVPAVALPSSSAASGPAGGTDVAALVIQASAASQPDRAGTEANKEFVDVCGVGRVRRSDMERAEGQAEPVWAQALNRQTEQGMADMLKRLDAGSLRQRVAAAVLRGDVQAAAQLAVSTDDVKTYRLAVRACSKDAAYRSHYPTAQQWQARMAASAASGFVVPELPPPGPMPTACAAINLERLELLDPGDAWPSVMRVNDAAARRDEAAVNLALYQLAQKSRLSINTRALGATVAEVIGAEPTVGEAWAMTLAVGTDMASMLDGNLLGLMRPCRGDALKDANRRQLCEQVARRMPGMLAEATDARALHSLEERLGLAHSPQALSREELDRGLKAMVDDGNRWMDEPTCANFSDMGQQLVKVAREGELARMKAYLKTVPASAPH